MRNCFTAAVRTAKSRPKCSNWVRESCISFILMRKNKLASLAENRKEKSLPCFWRKFTLVLFGCMRRVIAKLRQCPSFFCFFSWITFRLLTLDNDWPSSLSYRFRSWFLALFLSSSSASSASISRHFISARCGKIIKKISVYNTRIIKLEKEETADVFGISKFRH